MIDLQGLQALLAVESRGSVGGAAETLGFTPSAVSQQIKRLERGLGVDLLERVGRGVVLTERGRTLVEQGRRLLDDVEQIAAGLDPPVDDLRGTVRMSAHSTALRGIVAAALANLAATEAHLSVTVVERDPPEGVDLLLGGQVDLAVVHNWVGVPLHVPAGVDVVEIGQDQADLLVPASSTLARRRSVTPRELLDETFASTPVGTICQAWFVQMFAGHPRRPDVAYWSAEFATHIALVASGLAVALVPRMGRTSLPNGVVAVPVRDPVPTRQIFVIRRATMASSVALQRITDEIAHVAASVLAPPSRATSAR